MVHIAEVASAGALGTLAARGLWADSSAQFKHRMGLI